MSRTLVLSFGLDGRMAQLRVSLVATWFFSGVWASAVVAQEPNVTVSDLLERVYQQNDRVRSLEARFRATVSKFMPNHQEREWEAHYFYEAPDRYRIDYWATSNPQSVVSEGSAGGDSPLRVLTVSSESPSEGTIARRFRRSTFTGPNASRFFLHLRLGEWEELKLLNIGIKPSGIVRDEYITGIYLCRERIGSCRFVSVALPHFIDYDMITYKPPYGGLGGFFAT